MARTEFARPSVTPSIDDYFKMALSMNTQKLEDIIRGRDHSLPIVVAMAAYEVKAPMATAVKGQQAQVQLQQPQPTVRQGLEQKIDGPAMIPDMAMLQQQRMGPQPPVLPEQAGVGALPAPNMESMGMAHGGIVAFDDGGEVERYADTGFINPLLNPLLTPEMRADAEQRAQAEIVAEEARIAREQERTRKRKEEAEAQAQLEKLSKERREARKKGEKAPTGPVDLRPDESAAETARLQRQATGATPSVVPAKPTSTSPVSASSAAATPRVASKGLASLAAAPTTKEPDFVPSQVQSMPEIAAQLRNSFDVQEIQRRTDELGRTLTGAEKRLRERFEQRPKYEPFEKYEKSLKEEEAKAPQEKQDALGRSFVKAGLAVLGGASQYALQNLSLASVGVDEYTSALKDLKASAKERQKALATIEEARNAKKERDFDRVEALEDKILGYKTKAQETGINALTKIYDLTIPQATQLYNKQVEQAGADRRELYGQREATKRAEIGASAQRYAADRYSARTAGGQPNVAVDNARTRWEKWLNSPEGKMQSLKPGASDRKYQEFLRAAFAELGLEVPTSAGAATPRSALPPLDPKSTPDLFK
jgi:hypothetical protein